MDSQSGKAAKTWLSFVPQGILVLIAAIYLVLIPLGFIRSDNRLAIPELVLVAILILWVSGLLSGLVEFSFSSTGFSAKWRQQIESRQDTIEAQVDTLQLIVRGLVTDFELAKLQGLARPEPFMVYFRDDGSMVRELDRLDALRYIQPQPGFGLVDLWVRKGQPDEFDLKQYVYITDKGLEYLKLRDELLKPSK